MTETGRRQQDDLSDAALACRLLAVDPFGLGGAWIRGASGPPRDHWLATLKQCLPAECAMKRLPPYTTEDRLLGALDIAATLEAGRPIAETGFLAQADGGVIVMPSAERLAVERAALLAHALDEGEVLSFDNVFRPTRFAVLALDEGQGDDERMPPALAERVAFWLDCDTLDDEQFGAQQRQACARARELLSKVTVPDDIETELCHMAHAVGVASPRAVLFALKAARASAALEGRTTVAEVDALRAARLVLAPRATRLPAEAQEAEQQDPPPAQDQSEAAESKPAGEAELSDLILEAVKAALPQGLLEMIDQGSGSRSAGRSGSGARSRQRKARRGRKAGTRAGDPRSGARLNLVATLRAAAPWQKLRIRTNPDRTGIHVRRSDFQIDRVKPRNETTAIFVVDASGSAALHRLAEAKGAVELLLADCYVRRDKISLIAFRDRKAELLLPPTRSLQRAKRSLAALPGGGGTPLASAVDVAQGVAAQVKRGGGVPLLVFLTDGRANVMRNGKGDRAGATAEAQQAARHVAAANLRSLVIDVSPQPQEAARQFAQSMHARYLPLPFADAGRISQSVSAAIAEGAAAA